MMMKPRTKDEIIMTNSNRVNDVDDDDDDG